MTVAKFENCILLNYQNLKFLIQIYKKKILNEHSRLRTKHTEPQTQRGIVLK